MMYFRTELIPSAGVRLLSNWMAFVRILVDHHLIWPEASQTCQAMHSELVSIDNIIEYQFIHKNLIRLHAAYVIVPLVSCWTSGNDIAQEGTWVWGNNEEFTYCWPGKPKEHRHLSGTSKSRKFCLMMTVVTLKSFYKRDK